MIIDYFVGPYITNDAVYCRKFEAKVKIPTERARGHKNH